MDQIQLGPEEAAKLEAIERLVRSLREDAGRAPESLSDRAADRVASVVGSWKFLIGLTCALLFWIGLNAWFLAQKPFDPYPFILLNLCLSFQAAFTAPIILMAQNRAASKDRRADRKAHRTIYHIEELVKILATLEGVKTEGENKRSQSSEDSSSLS